MADSLNQEIIQLLNKELTEYRPQQINVVLNLLSEGNTVPFIARYRKEMTGTLDEVQIREIEDRYNYLENLEKRKQEVLRLIDEQGKLTEELAQKIQQAVKVQKVEDLYRPYKQKRRTKATIAKEKGLEPLANLILIQMTDKSIEEEAESYVSEEKEVKNVKEAIAGASDILAESVADEADYRIRIRNLTVKSGSVVSSAKKENEKSVYEMYYNFEEPISKLAGHRVLALNRGEKEKILTVKINAPEEEILSWLKRQGIRTDNPNTTPILEAVVEDSYKRLIAPAIEREIRNDLTEKAEDGSIKVFGKNLEQLLMQPPIVGKVVLGWDPAFRTGCKLAAAERGFERIGI